MTSLTPLLCQDLIHWARMSEGAARSENIRESLDIARKRKHEDKEERKGEEERKRGEERKGGIEGKGLDQNVEDENISDEQRALRYTILFL